MQTPQPGLTADRYEWNRFWFPRGSPLVGSLKDYLSDPQSDPELKAQWGVRPLADILDTPCLALLGEPGMGKSLALERERDNIDALINASGGTTLWLRLRSYMTDLRLVHDLFESPEFDAWGNGSHTMHVFLDDFDECHLHIQTLATLLVDGLRRYPSDAVRNRLRLRIASRTFAWPASLEIALQEVWGEDHFAAYELAPLRRADAAMAAEIQGLDPTVFLSSIDNVQAAPLASRPVTLNLLLRLYLQSGALPNKRADLYDLGCDELCRELNPDRRDARRTGETSPKQRRAIASRIAAATIFAGRYVIGEERSVDSDRGLLRIPELAEGVERVDGEEVHIDETAVRETLHTALFNGRGVGSVGWAHHTLGEYLATDYLVRRNVALTQVMSLLVYPSDTESKIVPQLRDVAAGLASVRLDVFREILKSDPEALLMSDLDSVGESERADLVEAILEGHRSGRLVNTYATWTQRRRYEKLRHGGLADQLRPSIVDGSNNDAARREAIHIADICELQQLSNDLVEVALDPSQAIEIRIAAAYSLVEIGDEHANGRLKPLVALPSEQDPDEELKGCALRATWPNHLTASELFTTLSAPTSPVYGAYALFLHSNPMRHLQSPDLPTALAWVEHHGAEAEIPYEVREIVHAILRLAWDHLNEPDILSVFAWITVLRLRHYHEVLGERGDFGARNLLLSDEARRRRLLTAVLRLILNFEQDFWLLEAHGLAQSHDVPWMVEQLWAERSSRMMRSWIRLIGSVLDPRSQISLAAMWTLLHHDVVLREVFVPLLGPRPLLQEKWGHLFDPILLGSPQAHNLKGAYDERQELHQRNRELVSSRVQLDPPIVRLVRSLERFESGDLEAWPHLNWEMMRGPNGHVNNELDSDLTTYPAWLEADAGIRERIVQAARRYIHEQIPEPEKWMTVGTGTQFAFSPRDNAGFRAFELLVRQAPEGLTSLVSEVWRSWTPVLVAYRLPDDRDDETQRKLIALAYPQASEDVISTVLRLVDHANRVGSGIENLIRKVSDCWDDRWTAPLLEKAQDSSLTPETLNSLLSLLLDHSVEDARDFAAELIRTRGTGAEEDGTRAVVAGGALMLHSIDAGWDIVWPAIQADSNFGANLVSQVVWALRGRLDNVFSKLSENNLADLYIWLAHVYPHHEDPTSVGATWVTPRAAIGHWREYVLTHLQSRGTHDAVEAVRRIARELPELDWLQRVIYQTREITRRATWKWPTPDEVLKLVSDPHRRLVHNPGQLLEVVVESLDRLEHKLQHAESQAVLDLWNIVSKAVVRGITKNVLANLRRTLGRGKPQLTIAGYWSTFGDEIGVSYNPKEENLLSDYVKRHLDSDLQGRGIVINREVQNRRREITDIKIDAVQYGPNREVLDVMTVIVEVKGCWHSQLDYAMKNQLIDSYLQPSGIKHGIYLVGWFNCDQWDSNDGRSRSAPSLSLEQAKERFNRQATNLTNNEVYVRAFVLDGSLRHSVPHATHDPAGENEESQT